MHTGLTSNIYSWLTLADELRAASVDYDERKLRVVKGLLATA